MKKLIVFIAIVGAILANQKALALDATSPIKAQDGTISITAGGTDNAACAAGQVLDWNSSAFVCVTDALGIKSLGQKANASGLTVTSASDDGRISLIECTQNQILKQGGASNNDDWACADLPATSTSIPAIITFRTETKLSAGNGTPTIYAGLSGQLSAAANGADVQTPLPGGEYGNLRCRASTATGADLTITFQTSTCGASLSGTNQQVILENGDGTGTVVDSTGTQTVLGTANQCGVFKMAKASNSYATGFVTCTIERTS